MQFDPASAGSRIELVFVLWLVFIAGMFFVIARMRLKVLKELKKTKKISRK